MGMTLKAALGVAGLAVATTAAAQATFYSRDGFHGQQFTVDGTLRNFERSGFNDKAESVIVNGGNWQVCSDANFNGHCVVLQPGEYPSLDQYGLGDKISSARPVGERYGYNGNDGYDRGAPDAYYGRGPDGYDRDRGYAPQSGYDWHRREGERLYNVPVTSVHAVVGPPQQQCWVERRDYSGDANVPGAIAGAVIGGILGHQIGNGHGRDAATAGGAVAGAALGANVGRGGSDYGDVQRCTSVPDYDHPDYWDVTYTFRGQVHHVQMTSPPGPTITVNRDGEPRE
jgi:uncharacterized protein YcfJ